MRNENSRRHTGYNRENPQNVRVHERGSESSIQVEVLPNRERRPQDGSGYQYGKGHLDVRRGGHSGREGQCRQDGSSHGHGSHKNQGMFRKHDEFKGQNGERGRGQGFKMGHGKGKCGQCQYRAFYEEHTNL